MDESDDTRSLASEDDAESTNTEEAAVPGACVDEDCRAKDRDPLDIDESEDLQDSAEGDHVPDTAMHASSSSRLHATHISDDAHTLSTDPRRLRTLRLRRASEACESAQQIVLRRLSSYITKSGKKLPEIISGCDLHNLHKHHNYCEPYREWL
ncbi:hypothetical protein B0H13DRAFT_2331700 [Mycena leptocephala]|nr:hypothetical protein B0H13DRAFT_2331700 [Mycena leptocephala]